MSDEVQKKATPGWYLDKRWPGEQRRWDGSKWLDHWRPTSSGGLSPEAVIGIAVGLALTLGVLTAVAFQLDDGLGLVALWISAVIAGATFNVGLIAKAVEIGVRAARRD